MKPKKMQVCGRLSAQLRQGKALLGEFWGLLEAITINPETRKKVRRGSYEMRAAEAGLKAALIKASAHFERQREFHDWLSANTEGGISAYDPIATEFEITNKLWDYERRLKRVEEKYKADKETLILIVKSLIERLPPEMMKIEPHVLEMISEGKM